MVIPILGITFGLFIGCSSLPLVNNSQSAEDEDSLTTTELNERLENIEQEISGNPGNAEAYYQKGDVLNTLAQRQHPPQERSAYYQEMRSALDEAGSLYRNSNQLQGSEKVDELLKVSWSYEHNQGVEILQSDSTLDSDDINIAAAHFNNAIIIIPDSVISYNMKAQAYYRNDQVDNAIQTLEAAQNRIDPLPFGVIEQLAYLYLEDNQLSKAVALYEQAESFSNNNLNLLHGLANAYIMGDEHRKAADLLERLVQNEPENVVYLESYGSELYQLGIQKYDSIETSAANDSTELLQVKAEADTLLEQAENQFRRTLQLNPDDSTLKQQLASLYQNYAFHLQQVKSLFPDSVQPDIEEEIETNLSGAVTLFEELVEQQPDQPEFWKTLYQSYLYLGMEEEAEQAKANANL